MQIFFTLLLTGIGLAMDAFAVSVVKGLSLRRLKVYQAAVIGAFFGGFQAAMPFIGWLLGSQFEQYIKNFDHWIAFGLLAFIGGKMLFETLLNRKEEKKEEITKLNIKELLVLSVATSIDALAVGISFAFLGSEYNIYEAITIIGVTTFVISFAGVYIGSFFGTRFKKPAEIVGGIILILIGFKILAEHLGIFK